MWVATQDLPRSAAHPFYARLNQILDQHDFDGYVEALCQPFYADQGRRGQDHHHRRPRLRPDHPRHQTFAPGRDGTLRRRLAVEPRLGQLLWKVGVFFVGLLSQD